jgi:TonB family protein
MPSLTEDRHSRLNGILDPSGAGTKRRRQSYVLSATVHVGLFLLSILLVSAPAKVQMLHQARHVILLDPIPRQMPALRNRSVPRVPSSEAKTPTPAVPTLKALPVAQHAAPPPLSAPPPVVETQLPLPPAILDNSMPGVTDSPDLFAKGVLGPYSAANGKEGNSGDGPSPATKTPMSCRSALGDPGTSKVETTPVEILFKPKPAYSLEAQELHLEGEVLLEVVFLANGGIRFVRVTRGLGHGLDEAATEAATQIRFKPARCAGVAMDVDATVHVSFRFTKRLAG